VVEWRWLDGLADEAAGLAIEAADAWTDAALIAARAGRTSDASQHAAALIEEIGLHPLIISLGIGGRPRTNAVVSVTRSE
jgi:hypothetical protein